MNRFRIHYNPSPDESGGGESIDSGATSSSSAGSAPDSSGQSTEPAETTTDGASEPSQSSAAPQYDFAKIDEAAREGVMVPEEFLEQYEQDSARKANGEPVGALPATPSESQPEQTPPPEEPAASEQKGGLPQAVTDSMAMIGAKTPEEIPVKTKELITNFQQSRQESANLKKEIDGYETLIENLVKGNPSAWEHVKKHKPNYQMIDIGAAHRGSLAPSGNPQTANPANPFGLTREQMAATFIDEEAGEQLLNSIHQSHQKDLEAIKAQLNEFAGVKESLQQEKKAATVAKVRANVSQELISTARKYAEILDLKGKPIESLVEKYLADPSNPPIELEAMINTLAISNKYSTPDNIMPFNEAFKLLDYDNTPARIAQAKIAAKKAEPSNKPATVGVNGTGATHTVANLSEADIEAMYNGSKDIPTEWFDKYSMPLKGVMPDSLYNRFLQRQEA